MAWLDVPHALAAPRPVDMRADCPAFALVAAAHVCSSHLSDKPLRGCCPPWAGVTLPPDRWLATWLLCPDKLHVLPGPRVVITQHFCVQAGTQIDGLTHRPLRVLVNTVPYPDEKPLRPCPMVARAG